MSPECRSWTAKIPRSRVSVSRLMHLTPIKLRKTDVVVIGLGQQAELPCFRSLAPA